jgi:hypothetical protein
LDADHEPGNISAIIECRDGLKVRLKRKLTGQIYGMLMNDYHILHRISVENEFGWNYIVFWLVGGQRL